MSVACIDLVSFFVIEESCNIFQSFRNCTPYSRGMGPFLRTATDTTTFATTAFIHHWVTVTCSYLSKAFPCKNIADIDGPCCNRDANTVRDQLVIFTNNGQTCVTKTRQEYTKGRKGTL